MAKHSWFEVSREGLRQLQEGKPKWYVVRELVQNAFDEKITFCKVDIVRDGRQVHVVVEDDSPEGFKDLTHAYTLFAPTSKRENPQQRGRFNLGEKQVLALATSAVISTTKGTIEFTSEGRIHKRLKRQSGSVIDVTLNATAEEFEEMCNMAFRFLEPKGVKYIVNTLPTDFFEPNWAFETRLMTELLDGDVLRRSYRHTRVNVHPISQFQIEEGWLYEMGLPVCEIACPYIVDVQQKVPLSADRETVPESYLSRIYAEVLNVTADEVTPENSSQVWIREASGNPNVEPQALQKVVRQRYGDKVVIANQFDPLSIDKAMTAGYRVIRGSELSKEEWANIKEGQIIQTSSGVFSTTFSAHVEAVEPTDEMKRFAVLARKIALFLIDRPLKVEFVSFNGIAAQYSKDTCTLTCNVKALGDFFFNTTVSVSTIDLIIHELGHAFGLHWEKGYHDALTRFGAKLTMKALLEPQFFKE